MMPLLLLLQLGHAGEGVEMVVAAPVAVVAKYASIGPRR